MKMKYGCRFCNFESDRGYELEPHVKEAHPKEYLVGMKEKRKLILDFIKQEEKSIILFSNQTKDFESFLKELEEKLSKVTADWKVKHFKESIEFEKKLIGKSQENVDSGKRYLKEYKEKLKEVNETISNLEN